jgi:hypothetical protein
MSPRASATGYTVRRNTVSTLVASGGIQLTMRADAVARGRCYPNRGLRPAARKNNAGQIFRNILIVSVALNPLSQMKWMYWSY